MRGEVFEAGARHALVVSDSAYLGAPLPAALVRSVALYSPQQRAAALPIADPATNPGSQTGQSANAPLSTQQSAAAGPGNGWPAGQAMAPVMAQQGASVAPGVTSRADGAVARSDVQAGALSTSGLGTSPTLGTAGSLDPAAAPGAGAAVWAGGAPSALTAFPPSTLPGVAGRQGNGARPSAASGPATAPAHRGYIGLAAWLAPVAAPHGVSGAVSDVAPGPMLLGAWAPETLPHPSAAAPPALPALRLGSYATEAPAPRAAEPTVPGRYPEDVGPLGAADVRGSHPSSPPGPAGGGLGAPPGQGAAATWSQVDGAGSRGASAERIPNLGRVAPGPAPDAPDAPGLSVGGYPEAEQRDAPGLHVGSYPGAGQDVSAAEQYARSFPGTRQGGP